MNDRMFTLEEYEDVKFRAYIAGLDAARQAVWSVVGEERAYRLGKAHERERNMVIDHEHRQESYAIGYAAGLDDAWEAVERASSLLQPLGPALAAIDALKEKTDE